MNQFFKELFQYNHDMNQLLSGIFADNSLKTSEKSLKLFSHLLNAHQIWNNRIIPLQHAFGVWQRHEAQDCSKIDKANFTRTLQLLDECDLSNIIHYSNSKGQSYTNSTRDICFHIINHSTYHRGQIATEFRKAGIEPLPTDYIFYKR